MADVASLLRFFGEVTSYVKDFWETNASWPEATLQNKCVSLDAQIRALPSLGLRDSNKLLKVIIDEQTPFKPEQKVMLSKAIDAASQNCQSARFKSCRAQQYNEGLLNYFTEEDWTKLPKLSRKLQIKQVARRMNAWGMGCASERLQGQASILLCVYGTKFERPSVQQLKSMKEDFREQLKSYDQGHRFPFGHRGVFPRDPAELPDEIRKHACGDVMPVAPPADVAAKCANIAIKYRKMSWLRNSAKANKEQAIKDRWIEGVTAIANICSTLEKKGAPMVLWDSSAQCMRYLHCEEGIHDQFIIDNARKMGSEGDMNVDEHVLQEALAIGKNEGLTDKFPIGATGVGIDFAKASVPLKVENPETEVPQQIAATLVRSRRLKVKGVKKDGTLDKRCKLKTLVRAAATFDQLASQAPSTGKGVVVVSTAEAEAAKKNAVGTGAPSVYRKRMQRRRG